jgi:hypothetical protein
MTGQSGQFWAFRLKVGKIAEALTFECGVADIFGRALKNMEILDDCTRCGNNPAYCFSILGVKLGRHVTRFALIAPKSKGDGGNQATIVCFFCMCRAPIGVESICI